MELYTRTDSNPEVEITTREFTSHGVTVPEGFEFDGASAPRAFWSIVPPFKRTKKAALLHDYLCRHAKTPEDREYADMIFYVALRDTAGISEVRCKVGWIGVRIGAFFGSGVRYKHWSDKLRGDKNDQYSSQ